MRFRPGGPAPGVYRYRAVGSRAGRGGTACRSAATFRPRRGWWSRPARTGGTRSCPTAASTSRARGTSSATARSRVTSRRTKVTFAGFGRDDRRSGRSRRRCSFRRAPCPARTGAKPTAPAISRRGAEPRSAQRAGDGGRDGPRHAGRGRARSTTSGPHPGTRTETLWWAPELGLPVRWDVDMDIGGVVRVPSRRIQARTRERDRPCSVTGRSRGCRTSARDRPACRASRRRNAGGRCQRGSCYGSPPVAAQAAALSCQRRRGEAQACRRSIS